MKCTTLHQDVGEFVCIVTASKNTWSHSRRKRRAENLRQQACDREDVTANETVCTTTVQTNSSTGWKVCDAEVLDLESRCDNESPSAKRIKLSSSCIKQEVNLKSAAAGGRIEVSADESSDEKHLISFTLELKLEGIHIKLSLKLVDGEQKNTLHQILQYFKNRLI